MERKIFWVSLALAGLTPIRLKKVMEEIKDIEEIFSLSYEQLIKMKVPSKTAEKIVNWKKLPWEEEIKKSEKENVKLITIEDENYPELLKEIHDPPYLLYVKGNLERKFYGIGIVGTRNPTFYGLKMAEKFAMELSSFGFIIISGLARGIDTAAHTGTIKVKGKTIGVLGSGFDHFYPPENIGLVEKIIENNGAVITEFPFGTFPEKRNFPMRNRIISGLSKGIIVVEAGQKSGALITANLALEQGREVFAIPGKVDTLTSKGTNQLLKEGAILVENANDIIEELNIEIKKEERKETKSEIKLNEMEKKVYETIKEKINIEKLLSITGIEYPVLSKILLTLQLKGLIKELPGKIYIRE